MRLPDFILLNIDAIVEEWEAFAATLFPSRQQMTSLALRDHVKEIMEAVAADIRTEQTEGEQSAKSKGLAPNKLDASETAAQTHAVLRAKSGLDIKRKPRSLPRTSKVRSTTCGRSKRPPTVTAPGKRDARSLQE